MRVPLQKRELVQCTWCLPMPIERRVLHTKEAGTCRPLDAYTYLAQVIAKCSEDLKYNVNVSVNANRGYGVAYQDIAGWCIPRYCRVVHTKVLQGVAYQGIAGCCIPRGLGRRQPGFLRTLPLIRWVALMLSFVLLSSQSSNSNSRLLFVIWFNLTGADSKLLKVTFYIIFYEVNLEKTQFTNFVCFPAIHLFLFPGKGGSAGMAWQV